MPDHDFRNIGKRMFASQDMRKAGPAPELVTENYTLNLAGNPSMNWEGHEQFGKMFYAAFPDLRHTFGEPVVENNIVVQPFTLHGTHTNDFMGIPATGKTIQVDAIAILEIQDGRVNKSTGIFDQLGMMRQLGVIP